MPALGRLRKSFVPPERIRALRRHTRLRDDHIRTAARYGPLMQKALDPRNGKLHTAALPQPKEGTFDTERTEARSEDTENPVLLCDLWFVLGALCDPNKKGRIRFGVSKSSLGSLQ